MQADRCSSPATSSRRTRRAPSPRTASTAPATRARIDDEGFLRVEGRKKYLLVLSTGKKLTPEPIELAISGDAAPFQGAVLLGEGRPFVSAAVFVAAEIWLASPPRGRTPPRSCSRGRAPRAQRVQRLREPEAARRDPGGAAGSSPARHPHAEGEAGRAPRVPRHGGRRPLRSAWTCRLTEDPAAGPNASRAVTPRRSR